MKPVWYLDESDVCKKRDDSDIFRIKGWIASLSPVEKIKFREESIQNLLTLKTYPRPDVKSTYGIEAYGFEASCEFAKIKNKPYIELDFRSGDSDFEIIAPVNIENVDKREKKRKKLSKIRRILRCPECHSDKLIEKPPRIRCLKCKTKYPYDDNNYNFLSKKFKQNFNITPTINVSANGYDGNALNLIHKYHDGLILDCGAGLREKYYANVVNFEIAAYASSDVIGIGERLPFKNNSFDAVFSFAVLEHVKDPFLCAQELIRVLKPGGVLYCQVPFLQPRHGFPHHYYNMTEQGMLNLFDDLIEVETSGPDNFGQPVFTATWFFKLYMEGLPKQTQESFKKTTIEELLKPGAEYLGSPFVYQLSEDTQKELACSNMLIGRKLNKPRKKSPVYEKTFWFLGSSLTISFDVQQTIIRPINFLRQRFGRKKRQSDAAQDDVQRDEKE